MKIVEHSDQRLVVTADQDSIHFMPILFGTSAIGLFAVEAMTGNIGPIWCMLLGASLIALAVFFLGYAKRDRFIFDATRGVMEVKTRQFWRDTTFPTALDRVSTVDVISSGDHETRLHALQFIGPDGMPLPFKRYIAHDLRTGTGIDTMQTWLAAQQ